MVKGMEVLKKSPEWGWVRDFIEHNCIYRVNPAEKPIPAKAKGDTYIWQFYLRRGTYNALFANYIGVLFWFIFYDEYTRNPFQIGGCETAGTPIACAIQNVGFRLGLEVNTFVIKKERKTYGLYNWTEGIISRDLPIMLVDDLAASQITLKNNEYLLRQGEYNLHEKYFTIIDKRSRDYNGNAENLLDGKELVALYTLDDLHMTYEDYLAEYGKESPFKFNF